MRDLGGAVILINDDEPRQRALIVEELKRRATNATIIEMDNYDVVSRLSSQRNHGQPVDIVITDQIGPMTRDATIAADGYHVCSEAKRWGGRSIYTIMFSNRTTSLTDATIPYVANRADPDKEPKVDMDRLMELIASGLENVRKHRAGTLAKL